ncbi:MAG TPA: hypothetical protein VKB58_08660 [Terriglobales bacterium]|jgi:hypothetical protein|nr:hypothetical protein [Terriglobales bacterium]
MNRTSQILAAFVLLSISTLAIAADSKASYPSMAPLDQYLMPDRNAEIALARSAAPQAISGDATILVLGRHGYETAVEGKNGFVCVVERSWMSPIDSVDFWNPKLRGPVCFNPPAARSILPVTYKRTEWALAGQSKDQIIAGNKAAYDNKELPALEPGAMSYMMSKQAYLTAHGGNLAHVMVYTPHGNPADWGNGVPNAPLALNPQFKDAEPIDVWVIAVGTWSDGSAAPAM